MTHLGIDTMVKGGHTACFPRDSRPPSKLSEKSIELGACTAPGADILASWDKSSPAPVGLPSPYGSLTGGREQGSIQQVAWSTDQKLRHGQRKAGVGGAELSVFQKPKGTDG